MTSRIVGGLLLVVVLGAAGFFGYMALVKKGILRYNPWDRREAGTLKAGDPAPDLALPRYAGDSVRLSSLWEKKPVMLVFGSCT